MNDEQKAEVVRLRKKGVVARVVAERVGCSMYQVYTATKRVKDQGATHKRKRPNTAKPINQFKKVGAPPPDPLERLVWANEMVALTMEQVATDPDLTEKERRQEIRQCSRELARLVPFNRLAAAEQLIRGDAAALQGAGNEELADATPVDRRIIRGTNNRGRPGNGAKVH